MKKALVILVIVLIYAHSGLFAENGFMLASSYSIPLDNNILESNVSFGLRYGFWGIFVASADMYTQFIYGEDAFLRIDDIEPLGLFSLGLGVHIPLGNFSLNLDWNDFYKATENSGTRRYCNAYKIGFHAKLSDYLALEAYRRTLRDFSTGFSPEFSKKLDMIGIGVILFL